MGYACGQGVSEMTVSTIRSSRAGQVGYPLYRGVDRVRLDGHYRRLGRDVCNAGLAYLGVHADELIASGDFSTPGGGLAAWNGDRVAQTSAPAETCSRHAQSLARSTPPASSIPRPDAPLLARWDGTLWQSLVPFVSSGDYLWIVRHDPVLKRVGRRRQRFLRPGRSPPLYRAYGSIRLGAARARRRIGPNAFVFDLHEHAGGLFVGGYLESAEGVPVAILRSGMALRGARPET
jgi:hypothetical protein